MKLRGIVLWVALTRVVARVRSELFPTTADPCGTQSGHDSLFVNSTEHGSLLQDCTTIKHTIWISKDYPGTLTLPKLITCGGIWIGDGTYDGQTHTPQDGSLTALSLPALTSAFDVKVVDVASLTSLAMPKLTEIFDITLTGLPALKSFAFSPTMNGDGINITNTGLTEFSWLSSSYIYDVKLTGNAKLDKVTFSPSSNVSRLEIDCSKGPMPRVSLPSTMQTFEVTKCGNPLGDWETVIQSSRGVYGSFEIHDNLFDAIGFANLTEALRGGFQIEDNRNLTEMAFPVLELVQGSFTIKDNLAYKFINKTTFPSLKNVSAGFNIDGPVVKFDLPPQLTNAFITIDSSSSLMNCSNYSAVEVPFWGPSVDTRTGLHVKCTSGYTSYSGGGSSSGSSGGGSTGGMPRLSKRVTIAIVTSIVGFVIWSTGLWWLWIRRRNRRRRRKAEIAALSAQIESLRDAPPQESGAAQPGITPSSVDSGNERDSQATTAMLREKALDAREKALQERERQIEALQARLKAAEKP